jgi:hypothetical protein
VAEAIVDRLEAVEVEREHREELAVARVARDLVAEPLVERAAVGQPGERAPALRRQVEI